MQVPFLSLGLALVGSGWLAPATEAAVVTASYYRLGEADPGAAAGQAAGETLVDSGGGNALQRVGTAPVFSADTGVTGSTLSLEVNGGGYTANTPIVSVGDNWGLEAWVQADTTAEARCIVYNGNSAGSGMGLYQINEAYVGLVGGVAFVGNEPIVTSAWTHLAIVVANGATTFYVNGVPMATGGAPRPPAGAFSLGIRGDQGERFAGRIDEVRVFTFSPDQFVPEDLLLLQVPPGAEPPVILRGATATPGERVMEGDALTLDVGVGGTAPFQYQWRKDGVEVAGATSATLAFSPARVSDAGTYEVVVRSSYGTATSGAVTVAVLPTGSPAVLAAGYYRMGEADPGATAGQAAADPTVDSAHGQHLTQAGAPPVYTSTTGVNGSSLALAVEYGGYFRETPLITAADHWGLEAWVNSTTTEENRCIVYNGSSANAGMGLYQLGSQFAGLAGGVAVVGGVPVTPGTWTHLAIVTTGGTTTFYVNGVAAGTAGRPNPPTSATSAFLVGQNLDGAEPFLGQIDEVRAFTVVAGHFSAGDLLLSRVPPEALPPFIVSGPTATPGPSVLSGRPLKLEVQAGGTAPVQYQWRKDRVPLAGATGPTLAIATAAGENSGSYDVVVVNAFGTTTSSALMVTVLPPGSPTISTLAYYRLGEADPGAAVDQAAGETTQDSAGTWPLGLMGSWPVYSEATGVSGSTLCLSVNGGGYGVGEPLITEGNHWGIEAWALSETTEDNRCVAYVGNSSNSGMGLYQIGNRLVGLMGGVAFVGGVDISPGTWVHLAMVVDGGTTTFYVNGVANASVGRGPNPPQPDSPFTLATRPDGAEAFVGRVDEVRLFRISLPGQFAPTELLLTQVPPGAAPPSVTLQAAAGGVQIHWSAGSLQQSDSPLGPWTTVSGATSPRTEPTSGVRRFFRAVVP